MSGLWGGQGNGIPWQWVVTINCPLPLVWKMVKRAKELGGYEDISYSPEKQQKQDWQGRHDLITLVFKFLDKKHGELFYLEFNTEYALHEREQGIED